MTKVSKNLWRYQCRGRAVTVELGRRPRWHKLLQRLASLCRAEIVPAILATLAGKVEAVAVMVSPSRQQLDEPAALAGFGIVQWHARIMSRDLAEPAADTGLRRPIGVGLTRITDYVELAGRKSVATRVLIDAFARRTSRRHGQDRARGICCRFRSGRARHWRAG